MTNLTNSWLSNFVGKNMWSIMVAVVVAIFMVSNYQSDTKSSLNNINDKLDKIDRNVTSNRNKLGETLMVVNDLCTDSDECKARNPKITLPE